MDELTLIALIGALMVLVASIGWAYEASKRQQAERALWAVLALRERVWTYEGEDEDGDPLWADTSWCVGPQDAPLAAPTAAADSQGQ